MRVLVTGATGYLGSHLVKALLSADHEPIILKRSFSNTERIANELPGLSAYNLDECELEQPFKDHKRIDVVIHTATSYGRKGERSIDMIMTNTVFPVRLLEMAALYGTGVFLNTDTVLPRDLNSYSLSKAHFAEWGKYFAGAVKMRFANIKLEHMYGPLDDESKFTTHVIRSCLRSAPELKLTLGEQERDFIYIDDVVSAYMVLLNKVSEMDEFYQTYELGSGQAISIRSFVEIVHRLAKSKTNLNFGALPYREQEVMRSQADVVVLRGMGWHNKTDLIAGIKACLEKEVTR